MKITAKLLIFTIFVFCFSAFAQTDNRGVGNKPAVSQTNEKRLALVIGNSDYQHTDKLKNPVNDATDMAAALKSLGFEVVSGTNLTLPQMRKLVRNFGAKLQQQKGIGLFYYAGHGIQVSGSNYLIPIDAAIQTAVETRDDSLDSDLILRYMNEAGNEFNIVILDACRDNPFAGTWRSYSQNRSLDDDKGLARITPPSGTIILYSTEPNKVADDGKGRNGLFTESLLTHINKPNVEFDVLVKLVARDVKAKSKGSQSPWKEGLYDGEFYFSGSNNLQSAVQLGFGTAKTGEQAFWKEAEQKNTIQIYELYISNYPKGEFVPLANYKIQELMTMEKSIFEKADNLVEEAWKYSRPGNYEKAIELYTDILKINSKSESAYNKRGIAYSRIKELDKAIADYTKIIEFNPKSHQAYFNRCSEYLGKKDYHLALLDAQKLLELNARDKDAFIFRGEAYDGQGKYDLAIEDFSKALTLGNSFTYDDARIYSKRGAVYLSKLEYDLAIADFTKAIDAPVNFYKYHGFLGRGKAHLGKQAYDQAISDFTRAIDLSPGYKEAYINRALAYEAIGDKTKANEDRQKAESFKNQ